MRKHFLSTTLALAIAAALPGLASIPSAHAQAAPAASMVSPNRYGLPDFGDLVEQVGPAVVNISVVQQQQQAATDQNPFANDPFYDFLRRFGVPMPGFPGQPGMGPRARQGIGSGFIVSQDGYVLTNAHVVAGEDGDAALSEVTVTLIDKREFKAKVVGIDRRTDVALLKIDAKGLPAVKIGKADEARVGEWVVAMGSPFGFDNTVTAGIISAKARRLPDETYVPFIQTDVAINPGNSGGPLFNLAGEVIGINSQIYSRSGGFMGISFAIPIDVAMNVKDQLATHGRVQRGRLGIAIQGVDKDLAQSFGLSDARGALVASVEPGSAAEKAGVQVGDVVLSVDGKRIGEMSDLPREVGEKRPGTRMRLEVWRDGRSRDVVATLDELTADNAAGTTAPSQVESVNAGLGLTARVLSPQEAAQLRLRGGLVVEGVDGPAARAGLQRGDIILALNNHAVGSVAEFRNLVQAAGKRFALLIQRGESRIYVPLRLE
ncbi:DegQ family serine endoprotease [Thauera linaloolentis]|uniref:Probable periplasmic serine endoprotease DegP-like n=1 Tax=Thauera linaloolentis (strain DSM 12138 / JCM 21573 / CCUG 41526 / CIP 105981 / IAM 15112 / NBRC 102519 / 47Lol) TaxID=1123367 RepID=N6Z3J1_THAL4|nr:DegQ family serine endoprotease [Thauera linaloolentis]ENO89182.1 protease Do [Thauera linaloolentis 47Lol = DSM 12138]MCM8567286.1 DegQ family serine endoprotease [Thauera linaloolentis]